MKIEPNPLSLPSKTPRLTLRGKIIAGVLAFFGLTIPFFLITGWPFIWWYNDYLVNRRLKALEKVNLPPASRIIAENKRFGVLYACGNHCDTEVMIMVESGAYAEQLLRFIPGGLDLYQVEQGRISRIDGTGIHRIYGPGDIPARNSSEMDEEMLYSEGYGALKIFFEQAPANSRKNIYILRDSYTTFNRLNMMDLRCH